MLNSHILVSLQSGSRLPYVPGIAANSGVAALFLVLAAGHLYWALRTKQTRFGFLLPWAEVHAAVGFVFRIILRSHQTSSMLGSAAELLVLMPAAAFMAFNVLVYGLLIETVGASEREGRYTLVPKVLVVKALLASAIISTLIQTGAGGLISSDKDNLKDLGNTLLLVSVIEQAVTYGIFILIVISSFVLVQRRCPTFAWSIKNPILMVFALLLGASLNIMIRTGFRIIQYSGGRNGSLSSKEYYIITFDAIVLASSNAHWLVYWPILRLNNYLDGSSPSRLHLEEVNSASQRSYDDSTPDDVRRYDA